MKRKIAIIGGGPSGLFLFKRLVESGRTDFTVDIFEKKKELGMGMPYSPEGANAEHVTNVSGNEIPDLIIPIVDWIKALPVATLQKYNLDPNTFTAFMVFPRLLLGEYLDAQFRLLHDQATRAGIVSNLHFESPVTDITDHPDEHEIAVEVDYKQIRSFQTVIVCVGHHWPLTFEGKVPGYYDSPYPPAKLKQHLNHPIAVRGSSLTAIDGIRTLARQHGHFVSEQPHRLSYHADENAGDFKITMYSKHGLLPAVRFHLDDPRLSAKSMLTKEALMQHQKENDRYISLDYIFEKDFKDSFRDKDPAFYNRVKNMSIEEFVDAMMSLRERGDPFEFFKKEYQAAEKSIQRKESIYWQEVLAILSFCMNYPAKHLSAEDMLRFQKTLAPLISVVIAFVPQNSCEELIALHDAGRLELISVGEDSRVEAVPAGGIIYHLMNESGEKQETPYRTFVDSIGQRHLSLSDFPFKSLVRNQTLSAARLKFRFPLPDQEMHQQMNECVHQGGDKQWYLDVPGIAITDSFRVSSPSVPNNPRLYMMSVPYIGGYNPDYSGLDFCEETSKIIVADIFSEHN